MPRAGKPHQDQDPWANSERSLTWDDTSSKAWFNPSSKDVTADLSWAGPSPLYSGTPARSRFGLLKSCRQTGAAYIRALCPGPSDPKGSPRLYSAHATAVEWPSWVLAQHTGLVSIVKSLLGHGCGEPHSLALQGVHSSDFLASAWSKLIAIYLEPSVAIFNSIGCGLLDWAKCNITQYLPILHLGYRSNSSWPLASPAC